MDKLTKKKLIKDLNDGEIIRDIFVVKIKKSVMPYSKGFSFSLILSDSSGGSIEYKYWGGPSEEKVKGVFNSVRPDSVVFVTGKVSTYNGKLQISSGELEVLRALKDDEYEASFIKEAKKNVDEMYSALISKINSMNDPEIKRIMKEIFEVDLKDKIKKAPGAISIHHSWTAGLLQHILEVIEFCETASRIYPELDRDLLLVGAMLHDIGKTDELEVTSRIKGSVRGQMIGHLMMGFNYLAQKLEKSKIDEVKKTKLLHLIVSHHGKIEFGSPKTPMIPEALAVYQADEYSSKVSQMVEYVKENKNATEDDFMYDPRSGTNIFLR